MLPGHSHTASAPPTSSVRTFHGRSGRLGPASQAAMAELWPTWGVSADRNPITATELFDRELPLVLELGSGMGEATAAMAAADRSTGILAVEVHTAGVAALLRRIAEQGLDNVRVMHTDGVQVLHHVPPATLTAVRLFFPDPWPKARHHKRRFVRPDLVRLCATRLMVGGTLHTATDWDDYADQMLEVLEQEPLLENTHTGFAPRPEWRPITRFERKGLRKGHTVRDLIFTRVD